MHATVTRVRIDEGRFDEARKALLEEVIPRVKSAPGFVTGYWLAPVESLGLSVIVFETEEAARTVAGILSVGSHPSPDVTVESIEVREVIGHA
jgi:hypothetical protein